MSQRVCRCEARIAPAILEGYSCGNPDCWRTLEAQAAFETFVAELKRRRGDPPPPPQAPAAG